MYCSFIWWAWYIVHALGDSTLRFHPLHPKEARLGVHLPTPGKTLKKLRIGKAPAIDDIVPKA